MLRTGLALAAGLGAAVSISPGGAGAAIAVAYDGGRPALRVDARGHAEVSWTAGGVRRFLLVPPQGRVFPGRRLEGPDVGRAAGGPALPFRRVLRRTPDGRLWALQAWRVRPGGPVELRLARWRGAPPAVTLSLAGDALAGRATFGGRPVPATSPTPEGRRLRTYVYLERFAGGGWQRIGGVATRADGTFRRVLKPGERGARYRAVLPGPNVGASLAPDVVSPVAAAP